MSLRWSWLPVSLALCACVWPALAQQGGAWTKPGGELIYQPGLPSTSSTADVVVVGTVETVDEVAPEGNNPTMNGMKGGMSVATVRVDEMIKGNKLSSVKIQYYSYGANKLTPNQQQIFLLKRVQSGYGFANGGFDVRPVGDADAVRKEIENAPLTVTLKSELKTVYFGQEFSVTVVVANKSEAKVEFTQYSVSFEAFAVSPRMKENLAFRVVQPKPVGDVKIDRPAPIAIEPGQEKEITLNMACQTPASWQLFPADTYLQMPACVRVNVRTNAIRGDDGKFKPGLLASTPLNTIMVGYPLPDEGAAE